MIFLLECPLKKKWDLPLLATFDDARRVTISYHILLVKFRKKSPHENIRLISEKNCLLRTINIPRKLLNVSPFHESTFSPRLKLDFQTTTKPCCEPRQGPKI
jgi:hypothetical protein